MFKAGSSNWKDYIARLLQIDTKSVDRLSTCTVYVACHFEKVPNITLTSPTSSNVS